MWTDSSFASGWVTGTLDCLVFVSDSVNLIWILMINLPCITILTLISAHSATQVSLQAFKQEAHPNGPIAPWMAVSFPATSHEDIIQDWAKPYVPSYSPYFYLTNLTHHLSQRTGEVIFFFFFKSAPHVLVDCNIWKSQDREWWIHPAGNRSITSVESLTCSGWTISVNHRRRHQSGGGERRFLSGGCLLVFIKSPWDQRSFVQFFSDYLNFLHISFHWDIFLSSFIVNIGK